MIADQEAGANDEDRHRGVGNHVGVVANPGFLVALGKYVSHRFPACKQEHQAEQSERIG